MLRRIVALSILALIPVPVHAAGYVVQPGDSLGSIAQRYHVSIGTLARVNGIQNVNLVPIGQVLAIPRPFRTLQYQVQWGDSLSGVAARYGTTVGRLLSLNPRLGNVLLAGEYIHVCSPCGGTVGGASTAGATTSTSASSSGVYVVQPGDTLTAIAVRYGTTPLAIVNANGLVNPDLVVIGSRLSIPGSSVSSPVTVAPYSPATTRALIVADAEYYGVEPAFALAISWQESGFNENMISPTGAIGAMQVEPYTGAHIDDLLGVQLNLYNVNDNVRAGVYWLSVLLRYYGGDERWAAAAYYQGTRSLATRGWFTDTHQYVADVMSLRVSFGG
jgi:N-acetylmuramoyl-L-alanine amidase